MTDYRTDLPRTVLWRRIDGEGMDACVFRASDTGFEISGSAVFLQGTDAARFDYRVSCAPDWSSRAAQVTGWLGTTQKAFTLSRDPVGGWTVNGDRVAALAGLRDVDLGFTPATNTNALRRLRLEVGEEVETTAVWLDTENWRVTPLRQIYRRLSRTEFTYRSPVHDYAATLVTDDFGILRTYPQLWTAVSAPDAPQT